MCSDTWGGWEHSGTCPVASVSIMVSGGWAVGSVCVLSCTWRCFPARTCNGHVSSGKQDKREKSRNKIGNHVPPKKKREDVMKVPQEIKNTPDWCGLVD